ncbi:Y0074-like protein, partial [Mya arenaria]
VAPAELEDATHKHPAGQDVAVIGGNRRPRRARRRAASGVRHQVSEYKQLHGGVVFLKEIPKSPSGKILRRFLKDMTSQAMLGEDQGTRRMEQSINQLVVI